MLPFNINGRAYFVDRFIEKLPNIDLVRWLESHPVFPKVYWKERDGQITHAAVGNLLSFSRLPQFSGPMSFDLRLYGGMRFSERSCVEDNTWQNFPHVCFWLPKIELTQKEGHTEAVSYALNEKAVNCCEDFNIGTFSHSKIPPMLDRHDTPSFAHWKKNVQTALEAISAGKLSKLVLARKTTLQFSEPISPWPYLSHLNDKASHATLFAFQLNPSLCFLGATPEKLFERMGGALNTDVMAATRPRGKTPEQDLQFEQDLIASAKEQREFHIVKRFLKDTISSFSTDVDWDGQDRILKTSHVQHIYNRLRARIKNEISDETLVDALHPTPALGGFPKEKALEFLQQIEPFDRGWYGAPVGIIGSQRSSLYIAIRSALIQQQALHLFAGTGLVQGSVAEQEWEELEHKIRPFAELFEGK